MTVCFAGSGSHNLQPTTWSAVYEDLSTLAGKVLLNSIRCELLSLYKDKDGSVEAAELSFEDLSTVYAALCMDDIWTQRCAEVSLEIRKVCVRSCTACPSYSDDFVIPMTPGVGIAIASNSLSNEHRSCRGYRLYPRSTRMAGR